MHIYVYVISNTLCTAFNPDAVPFYIIRALLHKMRRTTGQNKMYCNSKFFNDRGAEEAFETTGARERTPRESSSAWAEGFFHISRRR